MTAIEHLKAKPIAGGVVAGLGTASGQHGSAHYDHSESWVFHGFACRVCGRDEHESTFRGLDRRLTVARRSAAIPQLMNGESR